MYYEQGVWGNWALHSLVQSRFLLHEDKVPLNVFEVVVSLRGSKSGDCLEQYGIVIFKTKEAAEKAAELWNQFRDPLDYCYPIELEKGNPNFISRTQWLLNQIGER